MDSHSLAFSKILDVCDHLESQGIEQHALKRRDKREPGRRRKEMMEDRLFAIISRYFREQKKAIREHLELWYPNRKANLPPYIPESIWENDKVKAALVKLLGQAIIDGIALFGETEKIGIDYTLINAEALEWARSYGYELIKGIDDTTRKAVEKAISSFVETPGMTIGDVVEMLPYNEKRALTIATTEITRTYAEGNAVAGDELKKQFPGVKVVEIWFTNNDDRVCDICGPLDGKEVELNQEFASGIMRPPAHVNCRCWTTTTTKLGD